MPLKDKKNRKIYYNSWREKNKEYLREYAREYQKKNRKRLSNNAIISHREQLKKLKEELYLLLGNKCVRCGFSDFRAFQVHHINRNGGKTRKKFRNIEYLKYLIIEAKKQIKNKPSIELLCSNCHAIEHYDDRIKLMKRGQKDFKNRGGKSGRSKLIEDDVREIRKKFNNGYSIQGLAKEYGVGRLCIRNIICYRTWKRVE